MKLKMDKPTVRETFAKFRNKFIMVELHPRYLLLRVKNSSDTVLVDYAVTLDAGLMQSAKEVAGNVPRGRGRRTSRESLEDAQAKLYPRPAKIADGWAGEGRTMQILGPAIESRGISWVPVQFDDDSDGPEFFKVRGIAFTDTDQ